MNKRPNSEVDVAMDEEIPSQKISKIEGEHDHRISVLVLNSTGKVGKGVMKALVNSNKFQVYGMTRGGKSVDIVTEFGAEPIIGNYWERSALENAFEISKAKYLFINTDFFLAANCQANVEIEHGKIAVDVAKEFHCEHVVLLSAALCDSFPNEARHCKTKPIIENYLKMSGLSYSILQPVGFFDNMDDPFNYNPLVKGSVKFLTTANVKFVSCTDIGKAAAVMFSNPLEWNGKSLICYSWNGNGDDLAASLTAASRVPCTFSLAMPGWMQYLIIPDVYYMILHFETEEYQQQTSYYSIEEFKRVVPDAQSAEDWFRAKGKWSNGKAFGEPDDPDWFTSLFTGWF